MLAESARFAGTSRVGAAGPGAMGAVPVAALVAVVDRVASMVVQRQGKDVARLAAEVRALLRAVEADAIRVARDGSRQEAKQRAADWVEQLALALQRLVEAGLWARSQRPDWSTTPLVTTSAVKPPHTLAHHLVPDPELSIGELLAYLRGDVRIPAGFLIWHQDRLRREPRVGDELRVAYFDGGYEAPTVQPGDPTGPADVATAGPFPLQQVAGLWRVVAVYRGLAKVHWRPNPGFAMGRRQRPDAVVQASRECVVRWFERWNLEVEFLPGEGVRQWVRMPDYALLAEELFGRVDAGRRRALARDAGGVGLAQLQEAVWRAALPDVRDRVDVDQAVAAVTALARRVGAAEQSRAWVWLQWAAGGGDTAGLADRRSLLPVAAVAARLVRQQGGVPRLSPRWLTATRTLMDAGPGRRVSGWDGVKALVAQVVGGGPVGDAEVAMVVALAGVLARRRPTVGTVSVDLASLQAAHAALAPWWQADAERIGETLWWLGDSEPAPAQLPSAVDSTVVLGYRADRTGLPLIGGRSLRDVLPRADEAAMATLGAALLARAVTRLPTDDDAMTGRPVVLVPVPVEPVEQESWDRLVAEWAAIGPATASLRAPAPTPVDLTLEQPEDLEAPGRSDGTTGPAVTTIAPMRVVTEHDVSSVPDPEGGTGGPFRRPHEPLHVDEPPIATQKGEDPETFPAVRPVQHRRSDRHPPLRISSDGTLAINDEYGAQEFYATEAVITRANAALMQEFSEVRLDLEPTHTISFDTEGGRRTLTRVVPRFPIDAETGREMLPEEACRDFTAAVLGDDPGLVVFRAPGGATSVTEVNATDSLEVTWVYLARAMADALDNTARAGPQWAADAVDADQRLIGGPESSAVLPGRQYGSALSLAPDNADRRRRMDDIAHAAGVNQYASIKVGEAWLTSTIAAADEDGKPDLTNYARDGVSEPWGYIFAAAVAESDDGNTQVTLTNYVIRNELKRAMREAVELNLLHHGDRLAQLRQRLVEQGEAGADDLAQHRLALLDALMEIRRLRGEYPPAPTSASHAAHSAMLIEAATENAANAMLQIVRKDLPGPRQIWRVGMYSRHPGDTFHESQALLDPEHGMPRVANPLTVVVLGGRTGTKRPMTIPFEPGSHAIGEPVASNLIGDAARQVVRQASWWVRNGLGLPTVVISGHGTGGLQRARAVADALRQRVASLLDGLGDARPAFTAHDIRMDAFAAASPEDIAATTEAREAVDISISAPGTQRRARRPASGHQQSTTRSSLAAPRPAAEDAPVQEPGPGPSGDGSDVSSRQMLPPPATPPVRQGVVEGLWDGLGEVALTPMEPVAGPTRTVPGVEKERWQPLGERARWRRSDVVGRFDPGAVRPDAGRPRDPFELHVGVDGRPRLIRAPETKTGVSTHVRYDLIAGREEWRFVVRLYLRAEQGVSEAELTGVKGRVHAGVMRYFNEPGHVLPGVGARLSVQVEFVDSPDAAHAEIAVGPATARQRFIDQFWWIVGLDPAAYVHEIGHYLGVLHRPEAPLRSLLWQSRTTGGASVHTDLMAGQGGHRDDLVLSEQALGQIVAMAPHIGEIGDGATAMPKPHPATSTAEPFGEFDVPARLTGMEYESRSTRVNWPADSVRPPHVQYILAQRDGYRLDADGAYFNLLEVVSPPPATLDDEGWGAELTTGLPAFADLVATLWDLPEETTVSWAFPSLELGGFGDVSIGKVGEPEGYTQHSYEEAMEAKFQHIQDLIDDVPFDPSDVEYQIAVKYARDGGRFGRWFAEVFNGGVPVDVSMVDPATTAAGHAVGVVHAQRRADRASSGESAGGQEPVAVGVADVTVRDFGALPVEVQLAFEATRRRSKTTS